MNVSDKISIVSAAASVISCIIAFVSCLAAIYYAWKSGKSSDKSEYYESRANAIAMGQSETSVYSNIAQSRVLIEEASVEIAKLFRENGSAKMNGSDKKYLEILQKRLHSCIENHLNVYEVACGLYLGVKIDVSRFESTYGDNIKNLCEEPAYKKQMQPEATSKYKNIWKVYHKLIKDGSVHLAVE
jgi:hypothetical protein